MNETKIWFFEKVNKTDKHLTRLTKKKPRRHKLQIGLKEVISLQTQQKKKNTNYAHKFDNLDELDKFFERYKLPMLTQERETT